MCVAVLFVVVGSFTLYKQMSSNLYMMDHFFVFVTAVFMLGMLQSSWFYASCRFKKFPSKFCSLLFSCTDSLCPSCALDSEAKRRVQERDKAAFSDLKQGIEFHFAAMKRCVVYQAFSPWCALCVAFVNAFERQCRAGFWTREKTSSVLIRR